MIKEAIMLYKLVKHVNEQLIPLVNLIENNGASLHNDVREQIDIAFACRETATMLEELRKSISKLQAKSETNASTVVELVKKTTNEPARTEYCSANVKPRIWFKIPYKRTPENYEEYEDLMKKLMSLPIELDLIRPNAPGIADYCTELIGKGQQPIAKDISSTELGLTMRKLKNVDE